MKAAVETDTAQIDIRPLTGPDEFARCVALQHRVWGEGFSESVPVSFLYVVQRVGGVVAGAVDGDGELVGFVLGIHGTVDGRPAHWSHMLGVRPDARGRGVGRRLKEYQRQVALEAGIERMHWTYDPLVAENAHLNLNRLGARVVEYVPRMYQDTTSELHRGLEQDRLRVRWDLRGRPVRGTARAVASRHGDGSPRRAGFRAVYTSADPHDEPVTRVPLQEAARVRIQVPEDIHRVRRNNPQRAKRWREATREAFLWYMDRGYRVTGFRRDNGECAYVLAHPAEGPVADKNANRKALQHP